MERSRQEPSINRQSPESGDVDANERFQRTLERLVNTPPKPHKPKDELGRHKPKG